MDYGIAYSKPPENLVKFTHAQEIKDWDAFFEDIKKVGGSLCFLPSLYRNGTTKQSNRSVDKVLIERDTPDGKQVGVVMFNELTPYPEVVAVLRGLDRPGLSETRRILALDGGPTWGKAAVATDSGAVQVRGTSDPDVITNLLIFF